MQLIGRVLARDCKWIKGRVVGESRQKTVFKMEDRKVTVFHEGKLKVRFLFHIICVIVVDCYRNFRWRVHL